MAGQEYGKDQAELRYGGTIAFPSEHKTKLVRNRSVPFRSVPSPSEHGLNIFYSISNESINMKERPSWLYLLALNQSKHSMLLCILSFYVFLNDLHATNLRTN